MNAAIRVKICGITNPEDAVAAIEAGADALGFNLFQGSKRHVPIEDLIPWLPTLGGSALRVAVMVNPSIDEIRRVQPFFDAIQLHGQETAALCAEAAATGPLWKAFPLAAGLDAAAVALFRTRAILIDSATPGAFGGTGALIDLDRAAAFVRSCAGRSVWLSGGLNPGNVAGAVEKVRPYGVDVASGVESPGNSRRKDAGRIRAFIAAARAG
jgi:phosphoribosylanthranilate isomerase